MVHRLVSRGFKKAKALREKRRQQFLFITLSLGASGFLGAVAKAEQATVNGIQYNVNYTITSFTNAESLLRGQPWWNDISVAKQFAPQFPAWYSGSSPITIAYAYDKRGIYIDNWSGRGIGWSQTTTGQSVSYAYAVALPSSVSISPSGALTSSGNSNVTSAAQFVVGAATSVTQNGLYSPSASNVGQGVSQLIVNNTIAGPTNNADFNGVLNVVTLLPSQAAVNESYQQIIAEPYASFLTVGLESLNRFRQDALALAVSPSKVNFGADGKKKPWALLIDSTNTNSSLRGTNNLASFDYDIFQSTIGLEYNLNSKWSIGGVFGYGNGKLNNYEFSDVVIQSNSYSGGLYGLYQPSQPWKIAALAGYSRYDNDSTRPIAFGSINRVASADWNSNGYTFATTGEYSWLLNPDRKNDPKKIQRNGIRLKPKALVSYVSYSQPSITESGAQSLDLAINSHTADSLIFGIGTTLEYPFILSKSSRLIPRLSVGYQYDAMGGADEEHELTASFANVPEPGSLDLIGQNRGENDLEVGLNLEYEISQVVSVYGGASGSFWSNGDELSYGGGVRIRW